MTEDITTNKGTSSIHESSNLNANQFNNLENNVIHGELNGEIADQPETGTGFNDKKSFHITSVTVQRNSTDGNADESTDESRTEDLSDTADMSTANIQAQTPGFPENLIRKDDVLYKVTSVGSAPIIPTSAQYGIAVVSNPNAELVENVNKFAVDCKLSDSIGKNEFSQNGIEVNCGTALNAKEINSKNERFKVVKIESNEPFRRGRWVCMDFLDQSMDQAKKTATVLNENEKSKRKDLEKKSEIVNGTINPEIMSSNDGNHKAEVEKIAQSSQVSESTSHINGEMPNSISPNQTFSTSFVPPASVSQSQTQSLTHIIIPQGTQPGSASGSYGHSQSLPHSELQHVHQNSQQQPMHITSSLQQSFHQHASLQNSQGLISQGIQHVPPQPQTEPVYNQIPMQQQQPLLQQYQSIQQPGMNQPAQQRIQPAQPPPSQPSQHSNPHCIPQIPQQQSNHSIPSQSSNPEQLLQQSTSQSVQQSNQQFQQNQAPAQPLQHSIQQVPMQQQTFQHQPGTQNATQQIIHPSVQQLSSQHHSPQQSSQASVQQMTTPSQTTQATSQQQLQQSNIQQSVLPSSVPHMSTQSAVGQPPVQSSVQFIPQQQSSLPQSVIQQSAPQQSSQSVLTQSQPQQVLQQALPSGSDQPIHIQPIQQQQMLSQQMQSQIPQQQLQQQQPQQQLQQSQTQLASHQQQMQHIPQQTIPQQPPSQQMQQSLPIQMQQQQMQPPQQQGQNQQMAHHQQILQTVPQQQQHQPPSQILQSQMAPVPNMQQSNIPHQAANFQNAQQTQTLPPASQPQVVQQCVPPQQITPIPQSLPPQHSIPAPSHQQQPQTQTLQQTLQSTQSMQHNTLNQQLPPSQSMNGSQPMQSQYQNVPTQIGDQNIPVSASPPTYQHEVLTNLAQTDVIMPNQYPLQQQPQNISAPTQHQLHVSLPQQYQNTTPSNYANASNINLVSTSMSNPQTQQQFFSHQVSQPVLPPCSQPSCSVASQDLSKICPHHHQGLVNVTQPPLMSVSSQNLSTNPPVMQSGSQQQQHSTQSVNAPIGLQSQNVYSMPSQNIYLQSSCSTVTSHTSANVQTQTTPNSQPCSSTGAPMPHYVLQQPVPSLPSVPVPSVVTAYGTKINAVHPSQLASHSYNANIPPSQIYTSGHTMLSNNMPFMDNTCVEYQGKSNVLFPEQVAEYVKNEETSFQRPNDDAER